MDSIGLRLTKLAVSSHQHAAAVLDDNGRVLLSYRALFDIASRVCQSLLRSSPSSEPGAMIATSCRDGMSSVIAAYAIWLAGGVMVPIDLVLNPISRIRHLVLNCKPVSFLVAGESERELLMGLFGSTIDVQTVDVFMTEVGAVDVRDSVRTTGWDMRDEGTTGKDASNNVSSGSAEAAYVVYTSGSTGDAKGVVTTHTNVIEYAKCKGEVEGICSQSRVLLANHFTFDVWHGDLVCALLHGAAVVVSTRACIQAELTSILVYAQVTHCCMTPSLWSLASPLSSSASSITPADVPSLQVLSLGGEPMPQRVIDLWAEDVTLFNVYGATETTVFQTYALMKKGDSPQKIGVPYTFASLRLSEEGELLISGPCVSPVGYLHDFALTAEKFFISATHGLTFRTGDYGCFIRCDTDAEAGDDSNSSTGIGGSNSETNSSPSASNCASRLNKYHFKEVISRGGVWSLIRRERNFQGDGKGRNDDLVKIRGHRVTLGEVCTHVRACCAIADALCTFDSETQKLIAYIKLHKPSTDPGQLVTHIDDIIVTVRATVLARAPAQYVPTVFIPIAHTQWPLTVSGKTNKLLLLQASHLQNQWCSTFVPPLKGVESIVACAFERALGLGPNTVGRNDSFDALGGSSMNVLAVCRILEKSSDISTPSSLHEALEGQRRNQQGTIGLQEGEASSLLQPEANDVACLFGVVTGVFAPCELMKRPIVSDYAAFLVSQDVKCVDQKEGVSREVCDDNGIFKEEEEEDKDEVDVDAAHGSRLARTFITACGHGDLMLVQAILNIDSSSSFTMMLAECMPLHVAAASLQPSTTAVVKYLLEHKELGIDVNKVNARGTAASHIAAARGDAATLALILQAGATPGAKDSDRSTILHYAVRSGNVDTVLVAAAAVKHLQTRKGGLEQFDRWKRTAASWAVHLGFVNLLGVLEQYGAKLHGVEESLKKATEQTHGKWSERTAIQQAFRPERKKGASEEVITTLIRTMKEYANRQVDVATGAQATSVLRELVCANSDNRDAARNLGAIPILVQLAKEFADIGAIGALRNLPYRNSLNAAACGEAGAIEVLANVLHAHTPLCHRQTNSPTSTMDTKDNNIYTVAKDRESDKMIRVQYACAAALYGLRYKCPANVERINAIVGLEEAIGDLFKTDLVSEDH